MRTGRSTWRVRVEVLSRTECFTTVPLIAFSKHQYISDHLQINDMEFINIKNIHFIFPWFLVEVKVNIYYIIKGESHIFNIEIWGVNWSFLFFFLISTVYIFHGLKSIFTIIIEQFVVFWLTATSVLFWEVRSTTKMHQMPTSDHKNVIRELLSAWSGDINSK